MVKFSGKHDYLRTQVKIQKSDSQIFLNDVMSLSWKFLVKTLKNVELVPI